MEQKPPLIERTGRPFSLTDEAPREEPERMPPSKEAKLLPVLKYFLLAISILVVSIVGVTVIPENGRQGDRNLITRAVASIDVLDVSHKSSDPLILTEYVRELFGWDSSPPLITGATLTGAGVQELVEGFDLPAFMYTDTNGEQILVYTLNYRVLDDRQTDLDIDEAILRQLAEEYQLVVAIAPEGNQAVLWREYSYVFLAVTASEEPLLMQRINPKRSP